MTALAQGAEWKVVVVDDNADAREDTFNEIRDAGLHPLLPQREWYDKVAELVEEIAHLGTAAVCDHRLQEGNLATFYGAELVAGLYDRRIPSVLVTNWAKQDLEGTIRRYRRRIPSLIKTDDANPETLRSGLFSSLKEIRGEFVSGRVARRAIVAVKSIAIVNGERIVEALVPAWGPHEPISFPLDLVTGVLKDKVAANVMLTAWVNIGAECAEDLFLDNFELAPDPDEATA